MHTLVRQSLKDHGGSVRVLTSSMFPLIKAGQHVQFQPVTEGELRVGDVVVIQQDDSILVHRMIRPVQEGRVQTAGDFCRKADYPVDVSWVIGRVPVAMGGWRQRFEDCLRSFTLWRFK